MRMQSPTGRRELALADLAGRQWGVVSRRQLHRLGYSPAAIGRRVADGRLQRLHRGVYAVGHASLRREGHLYSALLAVGPVAVLSHRTAAEWWDLRARSGSAVEVTLPTRNGRRVTGVTVHCVRALAGADITVHRRLPVTTVARTLLDLAEVTDRVTTERALERAENLRLLDVPTAEDVLARAIGRHGARTLRAALAGYTGPSATRSELERRFLSLLTEAGLQPALVNGLVDAGGHCYEVDFAWPVERVLVETDGFVNHSTRAAFERDRRRDLELKLAGYEVIRVTWRQVTQQPEALMQALRRVLRR
jgi:predicted transcriptional regulator of viral defense system